jgi:uncharacterized RDD family membrane protein YckC
MLQFPVTLSWTGTPPDPLAHPELYDGLLWRRVFAYLFDCVVMGLLILAGWGGLFVLGVLSFGLLLPLVPLLVGLIPVAYHALQVGGHHHATFGMRVFDLEVKTWTGGQPDVWQGFLMAALFYATLAVTCSLILLVAVFNDRRRTLHDYLAGVVVVRRALGVHLITPPMPAM